MGLWKLILVVISTTSLMPAIRYWWGILLIGWLEVARPTLNLAHTFWSQPTEKNVEEGSFCIYVYLSSLSSNLSLLRHSLTGFRPCFGISMHTEFQQLSGTHLGVLQLTRTAETFRFLGWRSAMCLSFPSGDHMCRTSLTSALND